MDRRLTEAQEQLDILQSPPGCDLQKFCQCHDLQLPYESQVLSRDEAVLVGEDDDLDPVAQIQLAEDM